MFFTAEAALTHEATRWDRVRWSMRADAHTGLRDAEREVADALVTIEREGGDVDAQQVNGLARTFAGEVFARLAEDPAEVEGAGGWAKKAQSVVDELPEFEALRAAVEHDADMAALATKEILRAVAEKLPALAKSEPEDEQSGQGGAPSRDRAALRSALRRAIEQASESVAEAREALEGLAPGMGSTPPSHEQDDTTRLTLADMLVKNQAFREVLRRAGKLRRIAQAKAKTRGAGVGTVVGVERGSDLGRVLPSQLARLTHPAMRTLVKKDIAERALMQYRVEGHEPKGRGPIVLLVDESGSMSGSPQQWAKAVVIAAIRQGQAEKRPVAVCFFDTRILGAWMMEADGTVHNATCTAPAVKTTAFGKVGDLVTECLRRSTAGGTDFSAPFQWALSVLEEGDDRADMILVTDGYADADADTRARLSAQRTRGTRVYALTVGGGDASSLRDLADDVIPLDRIPEADIADRLAAAVPTTP